MFTRITENCTKESHYQLGSWHITLRTTQSVHHPDVHFPSCLSGELRTVPVNLTIYHQFPGPQAAECFQSLLAKAVPIYPFGLQQFYAGLQKAEIEHLPFDRHCNRYYAWEEYVLIDFPYSSDQFQIVFHRNNGHVFLFGPETSIGRILHDICCVLSAYLPIHGAAVTHSGKAVCFLGDSGSGKTFAMLNMLHHGYMYIADDELFLHNGTVYSISNHIHLHYKNQSRKITTSTRELCVCAAEKGIVDRSYLLTSPYGSRLIQLFPCVARQSFWWLIALPQEDIKEMDLSRKITESKLHAQQLLQNSTAADVDFDQVQQRLASTPPQYTENSFLIIRKTVEINPNTNNHNHK